VRARAIVLLEDKTGKFSSCPFGGALDEFSLKINKTEMLWNAL
jgi:hypothetical protein